MARDPIAATGAVDRVCGDVDTAVMPTSRRDTTEEFDAHYQVVGEPVMRRMERRVIGADFGATGYTTTAQADQLLGLLGLGPDGFLLDVGSGTGWPGIYLARSAGCRVALTDLPLEGLRVAAQRLQAEAVSGVVAAASGTLLPFREGTFDAVTSSDVLC